MAKKKNTKKRNTTRVVVQVAPNGGRGTTRPKRNRRKSRALRGHGDYYGPFATLGSYGGRYLGAQVDGYLSGSGDYSVKSNSIMPSSSGVPNFKTNRHSHRVSGSEFVQNIVSSATANTFDLVSINLSADNYDLFPALRQYAANYSEFKIHGLVLEYRPLSGDALTSTNTTLGRVVMATNYNIYAPNFTSSREMEAYEFATACKPSIGMLHPVECASSETPIKVLNCQPSTNRYLNDGAVVNSYYPQIDKRFNVLGNFQIATDRFQGTSVLAGELWAHYDVELLKPRLWASLGNLTQYRTSHGVTTVSGASPWACLNDSNLMHGFSGEFDIYQTGPSLKFIANDGLDVVSGNYIISIYQYGSGTPVVGTLGATGGYGAAPITGTGTTFNSWVITSASSICCNWYVKITAAGTLTWTGVTLPSGSTNVRAIITKVPSDFWNAN